MRGARWVLSLSASKPPARRPAERQGATEPRPLRDNRGPSSSSRTASRRVSRSLVGALGRGGEHREPLHGIDGQPVPIGQGDFEARNQLPPSFDGLRQDRARPQHMPCPITYDCSPMSLLAGGFPFPLLAGGFCFATLLVGHVRPRSLRTVGAVAGASLSSYVPFFARALLRILRVHHRRESFLMSRVNSRRSAVRAGR